jgi:hypothetical protein
MSSFRIRPRFTQTVDLDLETAQQRLFAHVNREGSRCEVKNFPGFISLRIPEQDQHFWSPQLHLSLESGDDGKTVIHGIYGPNTNVWSLFLYGYLLVGSLGLFSGILGFCQWMIGSLAWGLWIFGVMLAAAVALYLIAQFGQKLGAQQTFLLHLTYEGAMGFPVEIQ